MDTPGGGKARGNIIKVPDSSPGLLFVNGQQKSFLVEGVWRSPVAPAVNMMVDVEMDGAGVVVALAVVDTQQLSRERMDKMGATAQEQGKQAAEMAKQGYNVLVAKMGKVALGAAAAILLAMFFLPAVSLSFIVTQKFTLWEFIALDWSKMGNVSSHGLFSLIGLAAIAAPFAAPFLKHPRAKYLNAAPLAFLVLTTLRTWWSIDSAFGGSESGGGMGKLFSGMAKGMMDAVTDSMSLGLGAYVLIASALVLAAQVLKPRVTA
jgi:hypothetical protein